MTKVEELADKRLLAVLAASLDTKVYFALFELIFSDRSKRFCFAVTLLLLALGCEIPLHTDPLVSIYLFIQIFFLHLHSELRLIRLAITVLFTTVLRLCSSSYT